MVSSKLRHHSTTEADVLWLVYVILIGLVAGWAAGRIMKGSGYGTLADIGLGILGGIVGGFVIRLLGFESTGIFSAIVTAIFGAVLLIAIVRRIRR